MKSINSLLVLCILLFACNSVTQKIANSTADTSTTKTEATKSDNTEKQTLPNAYFKVVLKKEVANMDNRVGTDSESTVELWIDQTKIDSYEDYGDGEVFENGLQANVNSEMSEKIYVIELKDSEHINVNYSMIFEGEEKLLWKKMYSKLSSTGWKMESCKGECN